MGLAGHGRPPGSGGPRRTWPYPGRL